MRISKVIHSWDVKLFDVDQTYFSKMLLDDFVAGWKSILIIEDTLMAGCITQDRVHTVTKSWAKSFKTIYED
jgi:hypothetical protein